MRRAVTLCEHSVAFPPASCASIHGLIGDAAAAKFIPRAQLAVGEYQQIATAWNNGTTPAQIRELIAELGRQCKATAVLMAQLPEAAERFVGEAQVLEQSYRTNGLADTRSDLVRLASACQRAAKFNGLNQGQGNVGDDARNMFIAKCARIYRETTGKDPRPSRKSSFAKVMKLVLEVAGADSGLSDDLLKKIIPTQSAL